MRCVNCGHSSQQALQKCIDEVLQVLTPAASDCDAPNASVCRTALKDKYGSKRGRQLIELVLEDRIVVAMGEHPRRRILTLNKNPLNVITSTFEDRFVQN